MRPSGESSGSAEADTSWFDEFVREPQQDARSANSRAEFNSLYDEHDRLYGIYTRLGRAIVRFKRLVVGHPAMLIFGLS